MDRETRIRLYGSPIFPFEPTILADGVWHFSPDDSDTEAKYLPFDHFVIHNDSNSTIKVEYRNSAIFIYAGQSREEKNIVFRILKITELSSVNIDAGKLKIEISRQPMDADKYARLQAEESPFIAVKKMFSMSGGI